MSVSALERHLLTFFQRGYGQLTSSGSAALITALIAVDTPKGAEVIMPAICCPAVLFAIQLAGFTPVIADVSLNDFAINIETVEPLITDKTYAIVAVHNFGYPCDICALSTWAKKNELILIEDACLAMGTFYQDKPLGSFGDISIVSFGYDKMINAGYGGMLLTDSSVYAEKASQHLAENNFFSFDLSSPAYMAIKAGVAKLTENLSIRLSNTQLCKDLLNPDIVEQLPNSEGIAFWRYPVLVKHSRDELIKAAEKDKIIIPTHYKSLHYFYTGVFRDKSHYFSEHVINLFVRPSTPKKQLITTIKFINDFYS